MDDEAITILADYLDQYYYSDLNDEEFFSTTFAKTAERIMSVTRSPLAHHPHCCGDDCGGDPALLLVEGCQGPEE